jgi:hypothetical protein
MEFDRLVKVAGGSDWIRAIEKVECRLPLSIYLMIMIMIMRGSLRISHTHTVRSFPSSRSSWVPYGIQRHGDVVPVGAPGRSGSLIGPAIGPKYPPTISTRWTNSSNPHSGGWGLATFFFTFANHRTRDSRGLSLAVLEFIGTSGAAMLRHAILRSVFISRDI